MGQLSSQSKQICRQQYHPYYSYIRWMLYIRPKSNLVLSLVSCQPASPPHSLSLGLLLITARWTHSNRRRCIDPFHRRRRRPALYRVTFVVCRNCHHKSGSKVQQYVNNMHDGSSRMTLSRRLHKSQLNCAFYQHSTVKHSTDGLVRPISCPCFYRAPHLSRTMPSMWSNQFVFDS